MPTTLDREEIYRLRKAQEEQGKLDWAPIYAQFPDLNKGGIRKTFSRERSRIEGRPIEELSVPSVSIQGVFPDLEEIDEEEIWDLAKSKSRRRRAKNRDRLNQNIEFSHGPVCLVFIADLHLGDSNVDYDRIDDDLDTIVETPGMYACLIGDMLNNFIVGRLKDIRFGASFAISEEWVMVKRVLRKVAPKLLLSVSGNHDLWTYAVTSVDYLEEVHARLNPDILYAKYDNIVALKVGATEYILRARHKWKGYSQYNPTHGIEWAAKFDKGRHFDIGIAAHTHVSGLYRQFNNGGRTGHGIVCGSYKFFDSYAADKGFPQVNEAAAVALIINDTGEAIFGTNNLDAAASYMNIVYSG